MTRIRVTSGALSALREGLDVRIARSVGQGAQPLSSAYSVEAGAILHDQADRLWRSVRAAFEGLAPGGPLHRALTELVDGWLDVPLDWSLRVTLNADAASAARLGAAGPGTRLGVDTWLGRPVDAHVTTELPPYASQG